MDQIVCLACEPGRGAPGLGVAYDAAMISIDQIDSQFDTKAMGAVMEMLQNVLNLLLVFALHHSASLLSAKKQVGHPKSTIEMIQDALEKESLIVCYMIIKQSALLNSDSTKFEAILDLSSKLGSWRLCIHK
ncbi:hypothetical protein O181_105335 [Austropuccinia psidii MF-1]|uniref:Uncharacterized protein n=1 Tax=Austropuccinia psidii MF-1 TaxID=1389203 RepID=A0A9Q3JLG6_9BASI|nr:hypothetical protein [Austropuccinia psidii MF-1]